MELNPMTRSSYDWSLYTYSAQQGRSVQPHGAHPYAEGKHVPLVIGPSIPAVLSEAAQYNPMEIIPMRRRVPLVIGPTIPAVLSEAAQYKPRRAHPYAEGRHVPLVTDPSIPAVLSEAAQYNPMDLTPMGRRVPFVIRPSAQACLGDQQTCPIGRLSSSCPILMNSWLLLIIMWLFLSPRAASSAWFLQRSLRYFWTP